MNIDFKEMLNKLSAPHTGFTVVKLSTASNVSLYTCDSQSDSKAIKISEDCYVFQLKPGDIILQGGYLRGRKIFTIKDLEELSDDCYLVTLTAGGAFTRIYEIPPNYHKKATDNSLCEIAKTLFSITSGASLDKLTNFNKWFVTDVRITVYEKPEEFIYRRERCKLFTEFPLDVNQEHLKCAFFLNQNMSAEFIILNTFMLDNDTKRIYLSDGMFIEIKGYKAKLMFNEQFPFGESVLNQLTKPYKREEALANVTKDAESVKLD